MKILGHEVSQAIIDRAVLSFPQERSFTLGDLRNALIRLGVPSENSVAERSADRILQQLHKAGTHVYSGGKWRRRRIGAVSYNPE